MTKLVTFGLVGEGIQNLKDSKDYRYGVLKDSAKIACNFWNGHINPFKNIVLQIGVFDDPNIPTIARAWKPFEENGVLYGKIEFNKTKILLQGYTSVVMMHEIAHTLGFGWETLTKLYDTNTGIFLPEYVEKIPELGQMKMELDYGPGTRYFHWDEETFNHELMTGFKGLGGDYVLPVTIKIMELFGHKVTYVPKETLLLDSKTASKLLKVKFSRQKDVSLIDTLYEKETVIVEEHTPKLTTIQKIVNFLVYVIKNLD